MPPHACPRLVQVKNALRPPPALSADAEADDTWSRPGAQNISGEAQGCNGGEERGSVGAKKTKRRPPNGAPIEDSTHHLSGAACPFLEFLQNCRNWALRAPRCAVRPPPGPTDSCGLCAVGAGAQAPRSGRTSSLKCRRFAVGRPLSSGTDAQPRTPKTPLPARPRPPQSNPCPALAQIHAMNRPARLGSPNPQYSAKHAESARCP